MSVKPIDNNTFINFHHSFARLDWGLLFCCILYVILSSYHLGVPSLWMDEILVPMTSDHSLDFIITQSKYIEIHPPLYYIITKIALIFGKSDHIIRLSSVVFGLLTCIFFYFSVNKIFQRRIAVISLLFLIGNSHFLFLVRIVRPYSFLIFLFSLSLFLFIKYVYNKKNNYYYLVLLAAISCLMFSIVYISIYIIAAYSLTLIATLLIEKNRPALPVFLYIMIVCTCIALYYIFFISHSSVSSTHLESGMDYSDIVSIYVRSILDNSFYFNNIIIRILLVSVAAYGFFLLRNKKILYIFFVLILLIPFLQLIIVKNALNFWGRHISFLTLVFSLCQGLAVGTFFQNNFKKFTLAIPLLILTMNCSIYYHKFYSSDSYDVEIIGDNYKLIAEKLVSMANVNTAINFDSEYLQKGVNWYLQQHHQPAILSNQNICSSSFDHIMVAKNYEYIKNGKEGFIKKYGPFDYVDRFRSVDIFVKHIERRVGLPIDSDNWVHEFSIDYNTVYNQVAKIHNSNIAWSSRGMTLVPTQCEQDSYVDIMVNNDNLNRYFGLVVGYTKISPQNLVRVHVKFDHEDFEPLYSSNRLQYSNQTIVVPLIKSNFKTAIVRIYIDCDPNTPSSVGTALRGISLHNIAFISSKDDPKFLDDQLHYFYNKFLISSYRTELFFNSTNIYQNLFYDQCVVCSYPDDLEISNLIKFCHLRDGCEEGYIDVVYRSPSMTAIFYPRLGEQASIQAFYIDGSGIENGFYTMNGFDKDWTPISAQYSMALPNMSGTIRFRLKGKWSQIWTVNNNALFPEYGFR